jgi:heme exporter protein D
MSAWLAMGGYAAYVWPAYGVGLVVLGGLAAFSWLDYRRSVRALDRERLK